MKWKALSICIALGIIFLLINPGLKSLRSFNSSRQDILSKVLQVHSRFLQKEKDPLICPQRPVKAAVGEDITLDFHLNHPRDVTAKRVEWTFNNSARVLFYRSRGFTQSVPENKFEGRASLDSSGNLVEGKLALKISQVTTSDAGLYTCFVKDEEEEFHCSTELIIGTADGKKRIKNKAHNQSGHLFMLVLAAFLCLLYY